MSNNLKSLLIAGTAAAACACAGETQYKMGSYGYDGKFLAEHEIDCTELVSADGQSRVMIVPQWQARVMTTSAAGNEGDSYGWINYRFIESGENNPQFNPYGGEERFWFGPEGGPYSLYFKKGDEQVYANWKVPASIDTEAFELKEQGDGWMTFAKQTRLKNASDTEFEVGIERRIALMTPEQVSRDFGIRIEPGMKIVAYRTDNTIANRGTEAWTRDKGLISVWMLSMFNPTPTTTVFIPYVEQAEGVIVNDAYFGKIPADRLKAENGVLYFKIDGRMRTKLGIPQPRARELCGSYDSSKGLLTLLWCSLPEGPATYVNGQWGPQDDPYAGDVVNAYNDGPTDDGTVMGPFYEMETSSPGAELAPGASLTHTQKVVHVQGTPAQIAPIVQTLFGAELTEIEGKFAE